MIDRSLAQIDRRAARQLFIAHGFMLLIAALSCCCLVGCGSSDPDPAFVEQERQVKEHLGNCRQLLAGLEELQTSLTGQMSFEEYQKRVFAAEQKFVKVEKVPYGASLGHQSALQKLKSAIEEHREALGIWTRYQNGEGLTVERNGIIVKVEDGTLQGLLKVRWEVARDSTSRARKDLDAVNP